MAEPQPQGRRVLQLRLVVEAHDYDEALAFYRDILGLPEELQIHSDAGENVTILDVGRATLELSNPAQVAMIDRVEVGQPVSPRLRVAFEVTDAAAGTHALVDAGASLIAPPVLTPWSSLNARLNAPGDLQITLFKNSTSLRLPDGREPSPHRQGAPMTQAPSAALPEDTAMVVIDVQSGFDHSRWGPRNNPARDLNIAALLAAFEESGRPLVYVRHESASPQSPLHPDSPGNAFKPYLADHEPALIVTKTVHSSFHGSPDLDAWLRDQGVRSLVIAGITTNHCCETTARLAENLGYDVWFALDATHTFDRIGPDGTAMTADELSRATAINLHDQFATVVSTRTVLAALSATGATFQG